jgi:hypothetical protein
MNTMNKIIRHYNKQAGSKWTLLSHPGKCRVHDYTGGPRGKNNNEVLHINDSSSPVLHAFLWQHNKMRQIPTHPLLLTSQTEIKHKNYDTVENLRCIRNNKEDIFKTLQPF